MKNLDTNRDGVLDLTEFILAFERYFLTESDNYVDQVFEIFGNVFFFFCIFLVDLLKAELPKLPHWRHFLQKLKNDMIFQIIIRNCEKKSLENIFYI